MNIRISNIISMTDLRENLAKVVEDISQNGGQKIITVNGRPAISIQNAQEAETRMMELEKLRVENEEFKMLMGILNGIESIEAGKGLTTAEAIKRLGIEGV